MSYNRFRYYDPTSTRFISSDPTRLLGGENLYSWPPNPTFWRDPLGRAKVGVGSYTGAGGRGGHHIHAQSAMRSDQNYSKYKATCISQNEMDKRGIDHQAVTNKQRECYKQMAKGARPNTMAEHDKIAEESLIAGGADPAYAKKLAKQSRKQLDEQGVATTRIPWTQVRRASLS